MAQHLMLNKQMLKSTTQLMHLKELQEQKLSTQIFQVEAQKEQLQAQIADIDTDMSNNAIEKSNFSVNFYKQLKGATFNNKDFLRRDIELAKFDAKQKDLFEKQQFFTQELQQVNEKLQQLKAERKQLIVKKEKFSHILKML